MIPASFVGLLGCMSLSLAGAGTCGHFHAVIG